MENIYQKKKGGKFQDISGSDVIVDPCTVVISLNNKLQIVKSTKVKLSKQSLRISIHESYFHPCNHSPTLKAMLSIIQLQDFDKLRFW